MALNLLNSLKIKAIEKERTMSELIEVSGVSRDTFYKKLKRGDTVFYANLLKSMEK